MTRLEVIRDMVEELLAVELLEYHNQCWLDPVQTDQSRHKDRIRLINDILFEVCLEGSDRR